MSKKWPTFTCLQSKHTIIKITTSIIQSSSNFKAYKKPKQKLFQTNIIKNY